MNNVMHKFSSMCLFLFTTLYMFRAHSAHHQERQIVSIQPLVTVYVGGRDVCRLEKNYKFKQKHTKRTTIYTVIKFYSGAWGSTVVKALCYYPRRSRYRIPVASVTGIFLVDTDRTMCPRVNSASKKWLPGISLGVKAAAAWGWRPTTLVVPNVKKSGALTYPDPIGPSRRPVVGETFTFTDTKHTTIYTVIKNGTKRTRKNVLKEKAI